MNRHATLDELARLGADDLRPRKAAKVGRHLATCQQCTEVSNQLSGVPALLSSVQFPQMPQSLATRIDSVLAAEAAQRVAAEPATEADRRDLPSRSDTRLPGWRRARSPRSSRPRADRPWGWMPVPATRVLATAAAILIVGASGYEIATHTTGAGTSNSGSASSGSRAVVVPTPFTSQASLGPQVDYRQAGTEKTIRTVSSDANFHAATLADQASTAVMEAKLDGVHPHPRAD